MQENYPTAEHQFLRDTLKEGNNLSLIKKIKTVILYFAKAFHLYVFKEIVKANPLHWPTYCTLRDFTLKAKPLLRLNVTVN